MESKRIVLVLLIIVVAVGAFVSGWQIAQPPVNHFTMTTGIYRSGNAEMSTIVLLDTRNGDTWYLSVGGSGEVKWFPVKYY